MFSSRSRILAITGMYSSFKVADPGVKDPLSCTLIMIFLPSVSISMLPSSISRLSTAANWIALSFACSCSSCSFCRSASPCKLSRISDSPLSARISKVFMSLLIVICRTSFNGVGSGLPGLNSWAIIEVPLGTSSTFIRFCTPKASRIDPANCLNLSTSISEKDSSSTKKHINSAIKSPKVASQAGRPGIQTGHFSSSSLMRFNPHPPDVSSQVDSCVTSVQ